MWSRKRIQTERCCFKQVFPPKPFRYHPELEPEKFVDFEVEPIQRKNKDKPVKVKKTALRVLGTLKSDQTDEFSRICYESNTQEQFTPTNQSILDAAFREVRKAKAARFPKLKEEMLYERALLEEKEEIMDEFQEHPDFPRFARKMHEYSVNPIDGEMTMRRGINDSDVKMALKGLVNKYELDQEKTFSEELLKDYLNEALGPEYELEMKEYLENRKNALLEDKV